MAQLLATPVTPNYLTVDDSYRPVALPSVSVSVSASDGPAGRAFRGENGVSCGSAGVIVVWGYPGEGTVAQDRCWWPVDAGEL